MARDDRQIRPAGATRFAGIRARLEAAAPARGFPAFAYEFLLFGFKQGWACLFGALMLALLLATHLWWPPQAPVARYDVLTVAALLIQLGMLAFRLESWEEAKVILAFHIVGTAMELFKTAHGSWEYREAGVLRIGDVPLFSGFMYAAVGSYLARVWRIFDFRFSHYPSRRATVALAVAIYVNFFAHHWLPDIRLGLFAATALLYRRTWVHFRPFRTYRRMPLLLGFLLVALFIWFAENIGTWAHAWSYPHQKAAWTMVPIGKLGAWYLLMIISFVLVERVHGAGSRDSRT
ncbi:MULTISPECIES: DUF817 domain-containing protein [unclassified Sphingomonas]|uniref:DUF817 domain-containing protein n=1 Tax=unclassified Sphingomonas TaxID=196159 RepID=UPI0006F9BD49|nr:MULTISPECIES: DUF817 domain-containing protein [unclassified Sphingomonas]KQX21729.1 hypothetical protein ASD17_06480 [Sphingomonas sp. Root1294]KQY73044.1 hypothetical protein ASD39_00465 [Sphingomonas sp. Root50]KRB88417.1 hypothetical protein ASE22_22975 [Sphingomonas sp. Root720]